MTNKVTSFAPVADRSAQILILGSMPGEKSLNAGQYYAHPRNGFWKIMGQILSFDPDIAYDVRLAALVRADIALWDVMHTCVRKGSLDAAIEARSIIANDFQAFFRAHPFITRVCFNGATAERCYQTHVMPVLPPSATQYLRLPSTSPAHASLSLEAKAMAWRAAIDTQS